MVEVFEPSFMISASAVPAVPSMVSKLVSFAPAKVNVSSALPPLKVTFSSPKAEASIVSFPVVRVEASNETKSFVPAFDDSVNI